MLLCKSSCSNPTSLHLHEKSREVCIKTRSSLDRLAFIGQLTEHTAEKGLFKGSNQKRSSVMHLSCKQMLSLIVIL